MVDMRTEGGMEYTVVLQEGFILRKVSGFKLLLCYKEFLKHIVQHALHLVVDSCLKKMKVPFLYFYYM